MLDVGAPQIGPIALGLEPEHPGAGLPTIADLTADHAAGRVVATFCHGRVALDDDAEEAERVVVPALAARCAAAVEADVEAAPVVRRRRSSVPAPWCRGGPRDRRPKRRSSAWRRYPSLPATASSSVSPVLISHGYVAGNLQDPASNAVPQLSQRWPKAGAAGKQKGRREAGLFGIPFAESEAQYFAMTGPPQR